MKEIKLKPCPFCGGEAIELLDYTGAKYGFNAYELKCGCGCRMRSRSAAEHYWDGGKYYTPITERSEAEALKGLIDLWNRRVSK